jgi:uncharacterized membrane protein
VAALGLAENSTIVLVASMLISPLMVNIVLNTLLHHVTEVKIMEFYSYENY